MLDKEKYIYAEEALITLSAASCKIFCDVLMKSKVLWKPFAPAISAHQVLHMGQKLPAVVMLDVLMVLADLSQQLWKNITKYELCYKS
ncbi:hypothetical protein CEXT_313711 [Caerostris extrusa]|uniref:Uncharacterized protein n=1 Tax=Caerostris extrusa TaxID=172846 RepID=A0AAV4MZQ0_CAEEX|nr:hypothetical protein CEXT_313711 [Caerostris extrusa]